MPQTEIDILRLNQFHLNLIGISSIGAKEQNPLSPVWSTVSNTRVVQSFPHFEWFSACFHIHMGRLGWIYPAASLPSFILASPEGPFLHGRSG
jgi:hypothetical protein